VRLPEPLARLGPGRWPDLWRTTTFRLTVLYGAVFAFGVVALMGLIYWRTSSFLIHQDDQIVVTEANALSKVPAEDLPQRIAIEHARDVRHLYLYGLFSREGEWVAGNARRLPRNVQLDGPPQALSPVDGSPEEARVVVRRLPWGELLLVGRDMTQLSMIRAIILDALLWSGPIILVAGLGLGTALSLNPLRRIRDIQTVSRRMMAGDLAARLPNSGSRDELDTLADIVNATMADIERLVGEIKSVGDSVAHDMRTPLTRLRARLYRLRETTADPEAGEALDQALAETDAILARFRALLRLSELETRQRRSGFEAFSLEQVVEDVAALYEPVAEAAGVALEIETHAMAPVQGDPGLLFEAVGNLVDNAIKFTPAGGRALVRAGPGPSGPRIDVVDNGPGVPEAEREAVLQRFYRSARDRQRPGSGLGLSLVAAIARLHDFRFELADAGPGLRATLYCRPEREG
jgi:signal transduction histidine kinase